jgi:ribonuclease HII
MDALAKEYPNYNWQRNKGYPTKEHRQAIKQFGISPYHRKTFNLYGELSLFE